MYDPLCRKKGLWIFKKFVIASKAKGIIDAINGEEDWLLSSFLKDILRISFCFKTIIMSGWKVSTSSYRVLFKLYLSVIIFLSCCSSM